MIKHSEAQPKPVPKVVNQEDARQGREDADAAAVLAYFSRSPQNAPGSPRVASGAKPGENRAAELKAALEAKDAALAALAEEKEEQEKRIAELERRRAELRQILKDAGYYNDPKPLEKLGLRLISGRTHWKLQYANVRVTMSKTPSDRRANLNSASDTANRCF